jgi:hypothetical protein
MGGYRQPQKVYVFQADGLRYLNAEAISPYCSGFRVIDKAARQADVRGIWWCPSMTPRTPQDVQDEIDGWGVFTFDYTFFARAEMWKPGQATRPQDFTEGELRPDRLLMSDLLSHWHVNDGWTYGHGINGTRNASPQDGCLEVGAPMNLVGLNQLYGDGRVVWKSFSTINKAAISPSNPAIGMLPAYSTDSVFY